MTVSIGVLGVTADVMILLALAAAMARPRSSQVTRLLIATFAFVCAWVLTALFDALRAPGWAILAGGAVIVTSIVVTILTVYLWIQEGDGGESEPGRGGDDGGGGGNDPSWWPEFERQIAVIISADERAVASTCEEASWARAAAMRVKACLNGAHTRAEHPAVPLSPAELALDAVAVRRAGAFAVHVHPRDARGVQTLGAAACDASVAAIRAAVRGLPVGLSTSEAIDRDPFARAAAIKRWRTPPDFVSVNLSEVGWPGIIRAALQAGIGIEAGLATPRDADELAHSPFAHRLMRALIEVEGDVDEARAISERVPAGVPQLWHGYGERTWKIIAAGAAAGHEVRIGLEDVLVLPDGRTASNNAELVTTAMELPSQAA